MPFVFLNTAHSLLKTNRMKLKRIALLAALLLTGGGSALAAGGDSDYSPADDASYLPALIMVEDADVDETIADLQSNGVIIYRHRQNILLACIPYDYLPNINTRSGARIEISRPRKVTPTMNEARLFNDAYLIQEGTGLPSAYTGKGVVLGLCDLGMDTRHVNFLTEDGSECRIRKVVIYEEEKAGRTVYDTPEAIYELSTDNSDEWHATHVAGIAAGAYREGGFYGMAPDADIVFTTSQLSDVGLLAGVEDIIDYAKAVGKPAVINLSMGNYVGPHDGTSLFARYIDLCCEDAIICLSAGNEGSGSRPCSMAFDFTEDAREVKVLPNDWAGTDFVGQVEVWSKDATPFLFTPYFHHEYDSNYNEFPYAALSCGEGERMFRWTVSADPEDPDYNEEFAAHYKEGYITAYGGISTLNGRYYAGMEFELQTDILRPGAAYALYWPGIQVEAEPGTHVDIFCQGDAFLRPERTYPKPDNSLCFSDLATGFKSISVGMTCNTDYGSNPTPGSGYAKGDVCINSSYGTLPDGRVMPITCAPGVYVTSSMSSAYIKKYPSYVFNTDYRSTYQGQTYYWIATGGTSMACPFVAGTIATWVQANPKLTAEEALAIVQHTNQTEGYPDPENPRHGQGWFNPYTGLTAALSLVKTNVVNTEEVGNGFRYVGNKLQIGNSLGGDYRIVIHSVSGQTVMQHEGHGSLAQLDLEGLPSGIYVATFYPTAGAASSIKIRR